jgi:nitrite reductase (NADH) small subunit
MNEAVQWVRVAARDNIPEREGRAVLVGGRELALFNMGDHFLATNNRCPHNAGPLCDGIVSGGSVVCPLHAWKVNLESGSVERPTGARDHCVETYPTRLEDGFVSIGLPLSGRQGAAA